MQSNEYCACFFKLFILWFIYYHICTWYIWMPACLSLKWCVHIMSIFLFGRYATTKRYLHRLVFDAAEIVVTLLQMLLHVLDSVCGVVLAGLQRRSTVVLLALN